MFSLFDWFVISPKNLLRISSSNSSFSFWEEYKDSFFGSNFFFLDRGFEGGFWKGGVDFDFDSSITWIFGIFLSIRLGEGDVDIIQGGEDINLNKKQANTSEKKCCV